MKSGIPLTQIAAWLHYPLVNLENPCLARGACVDSRLLKNGDLFFACAGQRCDGHAFLQDVAERGAVAAVVKQGFIPPNDLHLPLIYVEDPVKALQQVAKAVHAGRSSKVIAITGSMGKTTTKGFLTQLLRSTYRVGATPGNSNSQIGLPLSVLNEFHGDEEILVLEMGMSRSGEIRSLVQIAPPDIAIVTGVSHAHFESFDSLEGVAAAKAEILTHPKTELGIIDRSVCSFEAFAKHQSCPLHTFSVNDTEAKFTLLPSEIGYRLIHAGAELAHFAPPSFPGKHNLHNFLAAASVAALFGVGAEALQAAAKTLQLPSLRLQVEERAGAIFIHDSYNALPIAVKAALEALPEPKYGGRKIAVLSEMRELGSASDLLHREVAEYALERVDHLVCMGKGCLPMIEVWNVAGRSPEWFSELSEVADYLQTCIQPGDVVLIKGSRLSGFSTL